MKGWNAPALAIIVVSWAGIATAHTITVDGNPSDWVMTPPSSANAGAMGRSVALTGEDVWNDASGDEGTVDGTEGMEAFPTGATIALDDVVVVANGGSDFLTNNGFDADFELNADSGSVLWRLALGAPCAHDIECVSGFCVGSACCDSACAGMCDDTDPCTGDDACQDGTCTAGANVCADEEPEPPTDAATDTEEDAGPETDTGREDCSCLIAS